MKKLTIFIITTLTIISFMQCSKPTAHKLCENANTRGKIISELMNDIYVMQVMDSIQSKHPDVVISKLMSKDAYMMNIMDSMKSNHPDVIISISFALMKSNDSIKNKMINNMMQMCKSDTSICKMMMVRAMDSCDSDKCTCGRISIKGHPKHDMCMCNMAGKMMKH